MARGDVSPRDSGLTRWGTPPSHPTSPPAALCPHVRRRLSALLSPSGVYIRGGSGAGTNRSTRTRSDGGGALLLSQPLVRPLPSQRVPACARFRVRAQRLHCARARLPAGAVPSCNC
eukprot:6174071-Pleurochrysis_carterae.AAC.1